MFRRYFIIACLLFTGSLVYSQTTRQDSLPPAADDLAIDTTIDYDELLNDLDAFLDSLMRPRSYFLASFSLGQGYFNFTNTNDRLRILEKTIFSPTIGYYSKSGLGLTLTGYILKDSSRLNLYQFSVSPSYDYLNNPDLATGIAYIRYFTKDSLSFYTSPLQNELNGYLILRNPWLQPGIAVNYGWGSRTEVIKRRRFLEDLGAYVPIITTTKESVIDFAVTASVRHHFYWLHVLSSKDFIRLSPQLSLTGGTQKYGLNQTTGTYGVTRNYTLYNAGNVNLDNELKFQPLSLTFYLRTEYSIGKFFLQPQLILDYYFPAKNKNFTSLLSVNGGLMF